MKKPLMLIPPAQAEALYDAVLHAARPGWAPATPLNPGAAHEWKSLDWMEDESSSQGEDYSFVSGQPAAKAQD
jgi:hypothetical protein